MTTKVTVMLVVAILLAACPTQAREVVAQPLATQEVHQYPSDRDPGDQCDGGYNDYYWTVDGWFTGNESYAVYCDPTGCTDCTGSWKPLSVTIYLYWEDENSCALTVHAEIVEADMSDPECPTPGTTVASISVPMTAGPFSPAGLWAVTIPMPEDCPAFNQPFFASVVFEDACGEPPQLVNNSGPCTNCMSWNNWGLGWHAMCDYSFPGDLSIYATMECVGSSPVQQTSWTTIKNMYRH